MDKATIKRVQNGDQKAFADLYNAYSEYALRAALAIVRNKMVAADAVQETFVRVYYNINSFQTDKPFKPWFYKILLNECRRQIKKSGTKAVNYDEFFSNNVQAAQSDIYKFEEYGELYNAIQNLHEINKIPIIFKYLNGFSEKEIAEIMGLNINTVKSRLLRGRQKLKEFLEKDNDRG